MLRKINYFITQIISYTNRQLFLTIVDRIHIVNVTERPK